MIGDLRLCSFRADFGACPAPSAREVTDPRVNVVLADAEVGVAERAPFDRILVTAGAWDIAPAWIDQLVPDGRLVVPLRVRGLTRSIAFRRDGDHLTSMSALVCGFVPMQGAGAHQEQLLLVAGTDEVGLRFDDGLPADPHRLDNAVKTPRVEIWTGVTVARQELIDTLQMYLATVMPGFCIMAVDQDLDTGVVAPSNKGFSLAAVDGPNFAYLTTRPTSGNQHVEYGVHAFGPEGTAFAEAVADQVRARRDEQRGGPGATFRVYPAGTSDNQLTGQRVIDKVNSRVTISWPSPTDFSARRVRGI